MPHFEKMEAALMTTEDAGRSDSGPRGTGGGGKTQTTIKTDGRHKAARNSLRRK